ncbi:hypothetical protein U0070_023948, partial [Myodes glareolus]
MQDAAEYRLCSSWLSEKQVDNEVKLLYFLRSAGPQKYLPMLWVKSGLQIKEKGNKEVQICLQMHCGCDLSVLHLVINLSSISNEDDCQYVVRKPLPKDDKKPRVKAPKIQSLITPGVPQTNAHLMLTKNKIRKTDGSEAEEWSYQFCISEKQLIRVSELDKRGQAREGKALPENFSSHIALYKRAGTVRVILCFFVALAVPETVATYASSNLVTV